MLNRRSLFPVLAVAPMAIPSAVAASDVNEIIRSFSELVLKGNLKAGIAGSAVLGSQPGDLGRISPDLTHTVVLEFDTGMIESIVKNTICETLQACWESIDAWIVKGGDLSPEQNAQRNGMVLAANLIAEKLAKINEPAPKAVRKLRI